MQKYLMLLLIMVPSLVWAKPPCETQERHYEVMWGSLTAGKVIGRVECLNGGSAIAFNVDMLASSFLKQINQNYNNHSSLQARWQDNTLIPDAFANDVRWRKRERHVLIHYADNQGNFRETLDPLPDPNKFTLATDAQKKGAIDPLSVTLSVWSWLASMDEEEKAILPQQKDYLTYEGRELYTTHVEWLGPTTVMLNEKEIPAVKLRLRRTPIAGFKPSSLKKFAKRDPVIELYLEPKPWGLPIMLVATTPIGEVTAKPK